MVRGHLLIHVVVLPCRLFARCLSLVPCDLLDESHDRALGLGWAHFEVMTEELPRVDVRRDDETCLTPLALEPAKPGEQWSEGPLHPRLVISASMFNVLSDDRDP